MGAVTIGGGGISVIFLLDLIQMLPDFQLKYCKPKIQTLAQALQGSSSAQRSL